MKCLSSANTEIKTIARKMNTMEDRNNWLVKANIKLDENEAKREHAIELQNIWLKIAQENAKKAVVAVESRKKATEETERMKTMAMKTRKRYAEKMSSKRQQSKDEIKNKRGGGITMENLETARNNMMWGIMGWGE